MDSVFSNDRLRLLITSSCNINCYYCHNEGQIKDEKYLSEPLFQRIVEILPTASLHSVTFSGGEALLHPKLDHFIREVRPYSKSVTLVTNGILLDQDRLRGLAESGLTKIRLGVDSFTKEKTRPTDGIPQKFDVIEKIKLIQSFGISIELNIVLTNFNIKEIPIIFSFCHERNIPAKVFEQIHVESFGSMQRDAKITPKPVIDFEKFKEVLGSSNLPVEIAEDKVLGNLNYLIFSGNLVWRYCKYLCPGGMCHITGTRIGSDGEIYSCMEKRFVQKLDLEDSLEEVVEKFRLVNSKRCYRG